MCKEERVLTFTVTSGVASRTFFPFAADLLMRLRREGIENAMQVEGKVGRECGIKKLGNAGCRSFKKPV